MVSLLLYLGEPKKERTRDVLAKLLTGMVSGMMGTEEEEEGEGEGKEGEGKEGKKKEEEEKKKEKKKKRRARDSDDEDDGDDPKKTFAEKYVGPPGTVVTIQSIPQPPFGIPTMNPQPGPSLCIRNSGDPNKPDVRTSSHSFFAYNILRVRGIFCYDVRLVATAILTDCLFLLCLLQVKVNFPMPPALQMLQDLLGGDSSSDEDEVVDKPESGVLYIEKMMQWNLRMMEQVVFCPLFRGCPFFRVRNVWTIIGRG